MVLMLDGTGDERAVVPNRGSSGRAVVVMGVVLGPLADIFFVLGPFVLFSFIYLR
jgi:hypothetical protein